MMSVDCAEEKVIGIYLNKLGKTIVQICEETEIGRNDIMKKKEKKKKSIKFIRIKLIIIVSSQKEEVNEF